MKLVGYTAETINYVLSILTKFPYGDVFKAVDLLKQGQGVDVPDKTDDVQSSQ